MTEPMNTFLCYHLPLDASPETQHEWLVRTRFNAYELQASNRRDVPHANVIGGIEMSADEPKSRDHGGDWNLPEMKAAYELSEEKFDGPVTDFHMHGGGVLNRTGAADQGGIVRITYRNAGLEVMKHEEWHGQANLFHAKRLYDDGRIIDYEGDGSMGLRGHHKDELNGAHRAYAGFIEATEIDESQEVLLCPHYLPKFGQHPQEIPCARVGSFYFYSYDGETVYCAKLTTNQATIQYRVLKRAGPVTEITSGIKVQHLGSRNQTVKFAIIKGDQPPTPVDWPENVLPVAA